MGDAGGAQHVSQPVCAADAVGRERRVGRLIEPLGMPHDVDGLLRPRALRRGGREDEGVEKERGVSSQRPSTNASRAGDLPYCPTHPTQWPTRPLGACSGFSDTLLAPLYNRAHDASTARVVPVAALRAAGDVHAAASRRGSAGARRGDRRRAVRRRHVLPPRRAARPARDPRAVVADPELQLLPEGRAVRSPERRRRRRRRRAAGQHREVLRGGRGAHRRDCRRRRAADGHRRRPFDLAAGPARARAGATGRWRWCRSTRTSTRGTSTSAASTFTARRSAARSRKGSSTGSGSSRSASAGRCTARRTSSSTASTASR